MCGHVEITVFAVASAIAGAGRLLIGVSMGTVNPFMAPTSCSRVRHHRAGRPREPARRDDLRAGRRDHRDDDVGLGVGLEKEAVLFIILFACLSSARKGCSAGSTRSGIEAMATPQHAGAQRPQHPAGSSVYATLMVGQFSLAQVGFCRSAPMPRHSDHASRYAAGPGAARVGTLCAVIGILLGYPCLRIRGIYLALATVAFSEVVRIFFHNFDFQVSSMASRWSGRAARLPRHPVMTAGRRSWPRSWSWSPPSPGSSGRASACRQTPSARTRPRRLAAGIKRRRDQGRHVRLRRVRRRGRGGLYATYISFVNSDNFGFHLALISIFYVAVGGTRHFAGPILGAILLTILPEALRFAGDSGWPSTGRRSRHHAAVSAWSRDELAARSRWLRRFRGVPSAPGAGRP